MRGAVECGAPGPPACGRAASSGAAAAAAAVRGGGGRRCPWPAAPLTSRQMGPASLQPSVHPSPHSMPSQPSQHLHPSVPVQLFLPEQPCLLSAPASALCPAGQRHCPQLHPVSPLGGVGGGGVANATAPSFILRALSL